MRTEGKIRRYIERVLLDGRKTDGDPLAAGLLDSLEIEQLVAFLEDEYGLAFHDDELVSENFADLEVLSELVDRKREAS